MTAEIAILNKMAVALAADSAVTIGRPPNIKIYNTVNKIFELSSCDPIRDMIRSMPKQELATLATSLVEVTSLKRKVSRMQETVGGEVDVAVISKSEGFVWIQRKHYFPSELNGRFFVRQKLATEHAR